MAKIAARDTLEMLVYNSVTETFYDDETGIASKTSTKSDFKVEDETMNLICSTLVKTVGFAVITILGIVLKKIPPAQLFI